jgi:FlaA1/EpsC-like NDP-sugar epimerase
LRAGEKLTERLSDEDEPLLPTELPGILTTSPQLVPYSVITAFLDRLADAAKAGSKSPELMALLDQARRNALADPVQSELRKRLRPV